MRIRSYFDELPMSSSRRLQRLVEHCRQEKESSQDRWHLPAELRPGTSQSPDSLQMDIGDDGAFLMNSWSFGQLCKLAGVNRDTVNRLSPDTAKRVFYETLPMGNKPLQVFTNERPRTFHPRSQLHPAL